MAEDLDVEAMLEAPYKKGTLTCHSLAQARASERGRGSMQKGTAKFRMRSPPTSSTTTKRMGLQTVIDHQGKASTEVEVDHMNVTAIGAAPKIVIVTRKRKEIAIGNEVTENETRIEREREAKTGIGMIRNVGVVKTKSIVVKTRRGEKGRKRKKKKRKKKRRRRRKERGENGLCRLLLYLVLETNSLLRKELLLWDCKRALDELSPEERDARTVFCMQLSQRIRARDLEEFFSSVGKVRDVRLITCNKTRRFKGIAYVEFRDPESVPLAMGLTGQKLLGVPIIVQPTQAEKNRAGNSMPNMPMPKDNGGPMRLYVGSLHFNITEDMLRGIFEPFGKIDSIQLIMDPETGRSKGYGFLTFHNAEDAKKALEQLNGFELAGRPMKVGNVTERSDSAQGSILDSDELDRTGIDLGATGRLQLMYKLAEGTGMQIPQAAATALNLNAAGTLPLQQATPPIATQCFMLANMFDPTSETNPNWDIEIRDDVIEECNKHGGVLHVYVDKASHQGNVYVKCPSIATAVAAVNSLHGRWFAGRVITAAYVPLINYHSLFPDAMTSMQLLMPSAARRGM